MDKNTDAHPNDNSSLQPARYWQSLEELAGDPAVLEEKSKEFISSPLNDVDENSPEHHLARREFFQIMGAGIALASTGCTRRPTEKIVPYVNQPPEVVPGVANWYASTCHECSAACGILVKSREGRPVKLEGNPDHPLSKGGLCARGQASVLNLYDPDRLHAPVFVDPTSAAVTAKAWEEFDTAVVAELKKAKASGGRVRALTGEMSGSSLKLVREFLGQFSDGKHVVYEPLAEEETALAQELSYGNRVLPRYHFEKARMVLSFGADFLGTWGGTVENTKAFSKTRKVENGRISRLVVIEPTLSLTGSNADARYTVAPGDQLKVAFAIAHEVIVTHQTGRFSGDSSVTGALARFAVGKVAQETGIPVAVLRQTAQELVAAKGAGVVLGGGHLMKGDAGIALDVVVNLLNSALENEGSTVDGSLAPAHVESSFVAFLKLVEDMKAGRVDVLLLQGVNPVYTSVAALGFAEALKKVPTVINFAQSLDETAALSRFVATDNHYLESWGDANPRVGVYSLAQPTISPLYQTRSYQDSLIVWARAAGLTGGVAAQATWYDYLRANWQTIQREVSAAGPFALFWEKTLREGVAFTTSVASGAGRSRSLKAGTLDTAVALASAAPSDGLKVIVYPKVGMADGRNSNNSWLQEFPDPVSRITWGNYASVNVDTAKKLNLKDGDLVKVKVGASTIEIPAHIQAGTHAQTVAIAMGYGRERAGRVGSKLGSNAFALIQTGKSAANMSSLGATLEKTGGVRKLAIAQRHGSAEGRPIIQETTFNEYSKNPAAGSHKESDALVSLWPEHKYEGYRWAMAIDLSSCTGCGACVIGCQSENNIPVVGYKDILNGREMHWIRIDRYYSGKPENPEVVFQPMLCQHCENAPCETVCPVLATLHDTEGLNQQVYNRCVGTRYCANNCPYKVRRFNWFTYTDVAKPLNFQYNPDVTVRTRGVMEKCTFCSHRIRDAKGRAKDLNRPVKDGEMTTACQQSCPTDAIVFGDINDKNSRIHKIARNPRGFHVLEELNTRPSITYLTKVRSRDQKSEGSATHGGSSHHS